MKDKFTSVHQLYIQPLPNNLDSLELTVGYIVLAGMCIRMFILKYKSYLIFHVNYLSSIYIFLKIKIYIIKFVNAAMFFSTISHI